MRNRLKNFCNKYGDIIVVSSGVVLAIAGLTLAASKSELISAQAESIRVDTIDRREFMAERARADVFKSNAS